MELSSGPSGMVHPQRLEPQFQELRLNPNELLPEQILTFVPRAGEIDQEKDRRLASVAKILAEATSIQSPALWAMEHEPWDFIGIYFDAGVKGSKPNGADLVANQLK